ncbi:MAG: hypothetical protein Q9168_003473 [Polycauliona sp. 1 TL-2023]
MAPTCTALNISDGSLCTQVATSINGLFCSFHSRQCQGRIFCNPDIYITSTDHFDLFTGLYRGYKNRNAKLDALDANLPAYLAGSRTPLANETFAAVDSEDTLRELHDYLVLKNALLDRVIRARKLHHTRFFSLNLDYGHEQYLSTLSSRRFIVVRALESLERRASEVFYKKQKWFKWVRQCQDDEETARETEKKKIKKEAALFRRHVKDVQVRMKELRAKEDLKQQEAYLDETYNTRISEEEQEAEWDPIEDVIEDERGNYVDLIRHILLLTESVEEDVPEARSSNNDMEAEQTEASSSSNVVAKKGKKSKSKAVTIGVSVPRLDKSAHDTKSQVRERLRNGIKLSYGKGLHVAGTIDSPAQTHDRTAPVPDEEIDKLLTDMAEIKHLLFSGSVEDFLNDKEVTDTDLRDLALKMDNPGLQEIRDACADLGREVDEEDDVYEEPEEEEEDEAADKLNSRLKQMGLANNQQKWRGLPSSWAPEREKKVTESKYARQGMVDALGDIFNKESGEIGSQTLIDFGEIDDDSKFKSKKIRVRVCGKYIYNYPSEKAINRGGWLHFCLIAKDSDLRDAIKLCRHWDEFFDLNILATFQYFPAAKWLVWKGDHRRKQLLQLGVIPYMQYDAGQEYTSKFSTGSRGQGRRAHAITESRNFICFNMRRDDPVSRRYLQYLTMLASKVVLLVRDAKTSEILRSPPKEQLWLHREKSGFGRASKNEWDVRGEVSEKFFEQVEKNRDWHFGFNDYYDVIIWDLEPGQNRARLFNICFEDQYRPAEAILRTIMHDPETMRTRDIKPGEQAKSIWEEIETGRNTMLNPEGKTREEQMAPDPEPCFFYGEADVLEDEVLFPEEYSTEPTNALYKGTVNALENFGSEGPNWERFVHDLETDEELSSEEDDDHLLEDGSESDDHLLEDGNASDDSEWEDDCADEEGKELPLTTIQRSNDGNGDDRMAKTGRTVEEILSSMFSEEQRKDMAVLERWKPPKDFRADIKADFDMFFDREKSRPFKAGWHAADLAPGGPERWKETKTIVDQMKTFMAKSADCFKHYHIVRFLDVHPDKHRRVVKDALDARAMALLFFSPDFLASEHGSPHKDSLLFNQRERALNPPSRRPHTSDAKKPKSFWDEFDTHFKSHHVNNYPAEWDIAVRPIIARLYKAGVIGPTFLPYDNTPGKAMAVPTGPSGNRDLYIDFRSLEPEISFPRHVHHPPSKDWLLTQIHTFAKSHPNARFSALRLWSAPHFYPLMIGHNRRSFTAFTDFRGRGWEWIFVPKDMPFSETSIHHTASQRLNVFKKQLEGRVLHMRDLFVVMGEDEEDCYKYTSAAIFMVQTEPWRLEVDLWRSFLNVDEGFLDWADGLGVGWLD